jgi:cytochrome c oxidase subunit 1
VAVGRWATLPLRATFKPLSFIYCNTSSFMAQANIAQRETPMGGSPHPHPDKWKWYHYFTFNIDHKVIGIQYLVTSFIFYLVGGVMALAMRAELSTPESDLLDPNLYNAFLTNHGTIMIFLWIVPGAIGGFGNYLVPLMIGARDMAFPKLNAAAFWITVPAGALILGSFFFGGAQAGWTSYPPLSLITANTAQSMWILAIVCAGTSSILGALNFIVTIWKMRVPSLSWDDLPAVLLGDSSHLHPGLVFHPRAGGRVSAAAL